MSRRASSTAITRASAITSKSVAGVARHDHVAVEAAYGAAQVMNHPADLINVAIEELVRQRCELPAFSTLDELVRHVRAVVDRRLFDSVLVQLSEEQRRQLDQLLESDQLGRSGFNARFGPDP